MKVWFSWAPLTAVASSFRAESEPAGRAMVCPAALMALLVLAGPKVKLAPPTVRLVPSKFAERASP